jgi:hypothetical protein
LRPDIQTFLQNSQGILSRRCTRTNLYHDLTHSYLIEFKYAKSDATETEITNKTAEGILQLEKYSKSGFVIEKSKKTTLHCLLVVYKGVEMAVCKQILEIKE